MACQLVGRTCAGSWTRARSPASSRDRPRIAYQFEALILWDDPRKETNIRLILTGDDGKGWRFSSRRMRNDSFILAPDGTFVGE